jgi:2,4-dienoyl-CoA reductase-like NADH-dependent reductase (Old Yellow Enzyme family)/thioredoxin reductase
MGSFRILEQGRIGRLELKNRIFYPALSSWLAGEMGEVTEELISHYERIAKGGAALIVVETTMVCTAVDPFRGIVKGLRADDDCYTVGLFKLTEAIHEAGAKVAIQLSPGGGSQGSIPWEIGTQGMKSLEKVSSSSISRMGGPPPRELTVVEIDKMIQLFGLAAKRVKLAEFDAIEIHAMGGLLIAQFLSPLLNKRVDDYGGDLNGRMKFLSELIKVTQTAVGSDFPILVRFAADEFYPGGRGVQESKEIAKKLETLGVHAISLNSGMHGESSEYVTPSFYIPRGHDLPIFKAIKEVVTIPVMVAGSLGLPELAEKALKESKVDFVGIGRGLLADPDLPRKIGEGDVKAIRRCIRCNECRGLNKRPLRCTVNAQLGREIKYGQIGKAVQKKKVLVIGGGPGGMEAARIAALRGHKVVLMEKKPVLGGDLHIAAIPPHKEEIKYILDYYNHELFRLKNLDIQLTTEADPVNVKSLNPDVVILATGGEPVIPPDIKQTRQNGVITVRQVLDGANVGKRVVIIGGGQIGCEIGLFLANQGKEVTILELLGNIGTDMEPLVFKCLIKELISLRVEIHTGTTVQEITNQGVIAIENGKKKEFTADCVVFALGFKPINGLQEALKGIVKRVIVIGNARMQGKIRNAISEGFVASFNI